MYWSIRDYDFTPPTITELDQSRADNDVLSILKMGSFKYSTLQYASSLHVPLIVATVVNHKE